MGKHHPTIGYRYQVAYHAGLARGPIDAFLEFRAGDQTAWSGRVTSSQTITIDRPQLFGGDKDQGGLVSDVQLMFGESTQQPNAYLTGIFGARQPAWRGLTTLVFAGGEYGAMNPYPQKPAYKIEVVKSDWADSCWYPDKAALPLVRSAVTLEGTGWEYQIETFDEPNTVWSDWTIPTSGWLQGGEMPFTTDGMSGGPYWTPTRSNIWLKRTVTPNQSGLTMHIAADNGCVVFVDGTQFGGSNLTNSPIDDNTRNPVDLPLTKNKSFQLVIKAFAEIDISDEGGNSIDIDVGGATSNAMNPAHILYQARTDPEMGRTPVADMDDASFTTGADWFYANGIGLCTQYDASTESVDQFISRIQTVAGCSISRDVTDGKWHLDIANGVYTLADLPILTDDDILDFQEQPSTLDGAANSMSVEFMDPVKKTTVTTSPLEAMALINAFGTIHQVTQYHEVPTYDLALQLAQRDLRATVTPKRTFALTTTRVTYDWRPNTYFRLQAPRRGIADMVCIFAEKSTGTLKSGAIKISASQDVYSLPTTTFVDAERGVDTSAPETPSAITLQAAYEAPYVQLAGTLPSTTLDALADDAGYLATIAADPSRSINYTLATSPDGSAYTDAGTGDWVPHADIVEGDDLTAAPATSFTLTNAVRAGEVATGSMAMWDDEIVRIDAIDADAGTLTLGRGCADTIPAQHDAGARIWFVGDLAASDNVEYTDGETEYVELLTNTGSNQLDAAAATAMTVAFAGRAALPYPPGKFRVNGDFSPGAITGTITVTWAARNRLTQADQLIDSSADAVTADQWVRYALSIADSDDNVLVDKLDIDPAAGTASATLDYTGDISITFYAINEAGDSRDKHTRALSYTPPASPTTAITADTWDEPYTIIDGGP